MSIATGVGPPLSGPAPPPPGPDRGRPPDAAPGRWSRSARPVAITAGVAEMLGSTALTGVLQGFRWLGYVIVAIGVVVLLGQLPWAGRSRAVLAPLAQLAALLLVLTALFTDHGAAGVLPTADAFADLVRGLGAAVAQIENGVPPVASSPEMILLVCVGFGGMAVLVDALTFVGLGSVACGLVLLGSFTVPTALAPDELPWWTVAAGAAGYVAVLLAEHRRRQARRGIPGGPAPRTGTGPGAGSGGSALARARRRLGALPVNRGGAPTAVALTAVAVLVALGAGLAASPLIGTEGRFPGNGRGPSDANAGQFGLNPFTALRGQLSRDEPKELFRVRGMAGPSYLRAVTLSRFVPTQGWQLPDRYNGVSLDHTLPSGLPTPARNPVVTVQFQNVGYKDQWLPLYGQPVSIAGTVPGRWHYDVSSSTAYADAPVREPTWTERMGLPDPAVSGLRSSPTVTDVSPTYLDVNGVDPQITAIARAVTKRAQSPFDKAVALNRYFIDPAFGFRYSLRTAPGSSDNALVDFLTRGKRGYCEQFASAMAVLLRTVGVPARVAIGFSAGQQVADYRSIGTGDAHAWVEAYFTGYGWLTFDPTPLQDGRGVQPNYVRNAPTVPINPLASALAAGPPQPAPGSTPPPGQEPGSGARPEQQPGQQGASSPQPDNQPGPNPRPGGDASAGAGGPTPNGPSGSGDPGAGSSGPSDTGAGSGDSGSGAGDSGSGDSGGSDGADSAGSGPDGAGSDGSGSGLRLGALSPLVWALLLSGLALLVACALGATPWVLRRLARGRRMARAQAGGAAGATAAWQEVLAEFRDRGDEPRRNDTLRTAARRLASARPLDAAATQGLRTVVGAVERSWYGRSAGDVGSGAELVAAVTAVRASLDSSSPLALNARLLPRSVVPSPPRRRPRPAEHGAEPTLTSSAR
ncbi:MAG TPA: transglutaminaseTgpA domain-containing protein [Pseudonocardia sp.]